MSLSLQVIGQLTSSTTDEDREVDERFLELPTSSLNTLVRLKLSTYPWGQIKLNLADLLNDIACGQYKMS